MFHVGYNERNSAAKCFANEGINPCEILTTSLQTKIMCSNLQISKQEI